MKPRHVGSRLKGLVASKRFLGTVIVVVTITAVAISYTMQNGLPFVPSYDFAVDVPNAAGLNKNADVRIGGARVGQIIEIQALPGGTVGPPRAKLSVRLQKSYQELPTDTEAQVRLNSPLGGRYLELSPGRSKHGIRPGGTLGLRHSEPSVTLDDALQAFGPPVPGDVRRTILGLGNGVAGRGGAMNEAVGSTARLIGPLQRVLATLNDPRTNLAGFLQAAAGATSSLVPVADALGTMLDRGARTLAAVEAAGPALETTLDDLPATESTSERTLRHLDPVLGQTARITAELRPGAALFPLAARRIDAFLLATDPVLDRVPDLSGRLSRTLVSVDRAAKDPLVTSAFRVLGGNDLGTFGASAFFALGGLLRDASDAQFFCNTPTLWARNLSSSFSEGNDAGAWIRMAFVLNVGQMVQTEAPSPDLHANPYPKEGRGECESGNEPYRPGRQIGSPAGSQGHATELTSAPPGVLARGARAGLVPPEGGGG